MATAHKMNRNIRVWGVDPDADCLPRFNYSNGAGWRTKNKGRVKWDSRTTNKGKTRRCYR